MKYLILIISMFWSVVAYSYSFTVNFAWDASISPNVLGYRMYYGTSSGLYDQTPIGTFDGLTGTLTGFDPNTTYYFALKSYNLDGESAGYSNEVSVTTPPDVPACTPPDTLVNGVCTPPPPACDPPNTLINGFCTPPPPPPVCNLPNTIVNGVCVPPAISCGPNEVLDNDVCIPVQTCNAPNMMIAGNCVAPTVDFKATATTGVGSLSTTLTALTNVPNPSCFWKFDTWTGQQMLTDTANTCSPIKTFAVGLTDVYLTINDLQPLLKIDYIIVTPLVCNAPNTVVNGVCTPPPPPVCNAPNTVVNGVCTPPTQVCNSPNIIINNVCTLPVLDFTATTTSGVRSITPSFSITTNVPNPTCIWKFERHSGTQTYTSSSKRCSVTKTIGIGSTDVTLTVNGNINLMKVGYIVVTRR